MKYRRRYVVIILTLTLMTMISGCNTEKVKDTNTSFADNQHKKAEDKTTADNTDTLIVYFSRVGNTKNQEELDATSSASIVKKQETLYGNTQYVASLIQEATKGDLHLIEVKDKYPSDYDQTVDRAKEEEATDSRLELATKVKGMERYSNIYLGYPNWWYNMPMAVHSFLDEYDLSGKTIIPFCTSGGSKFSDSIQKIKEMEPDATVIEDGFFVSDDDIDQCTLKDVKDWIDKRK